MRQGFYNENAFPWLDRRRKAAHAATLMRRIKK